MFLPRRYVGFFLIALMLGLVSYMVMVGAEPFIVGMLMGVGVAVFFYYQFVMPRRASQTKIKRKNDALQTNSEDDFIPEALMDQPDDEVYSGSLADLMQSGKRKNQIHEP